MNGTSPCNSAWRWVQRVGRRLEMLIGVDSEEVRVKKKNDAIEQEFGRHCGLVKGAEELFPHRKGKRFDLECVRRVLVGRVRCRGPLQILMHNTVDDLMDDEAAVEVG